MIFWSQQMDRTYYQCTESKMTVYLNRSFLLTLALQTMTCVMALLIPAWSKLSHDLSESKSHHDQKLSSILIVIIVPYKLVMGSW